MRTMAFVFISVSLGVERPIILLPLLGMDANLERFHIPNCLLSHIEH